MPRRALIALLVCFVGTAIVPGWVAPRAVAADHVLVGAGDIGECDKSDDEATAKLLDDIPGTIFTPGDNVYEDGTTSEFANCFEPSWGRHKDRIRPALGDHEYMTAGAAPYFKYFGSAAGPAPEGYYSYDLGAWHIVVLNSSCDEVKGGCGANSPQVQWLRNDLRSTDAECIAAVWHRHRFSSGTRHYGRNAEVTPFWETLQAFGADVVLNGHTHVYERFGLQDVDGRADPDGIRQFTVGTGGRFLEGFKSPLPNSQFRYRADHGVLKLSLRSSSYEWDFIRADGGAVVDSGSTDCHGKVTLPSLPNLVTVEPEADARVASASPKKNYGTRALLEVDQSPAMEGFLRFRVADVSGTVTRARLRLYVTSGTKNAPALYRADPAADWSETGITWDNKPARIGDELDDLGRVSSKRYVEYDVTDAVNGDGTYTFVLVPESSDGVAFSSGEADANRPQLVIGTD